MSAMDSLRQSWANSFDGSKAGLADSPDPRRLAATVAPLRLRGELPGGDILVSTGEKQSR